MTEMFKYIIDLLIAPIAYLRFNVAKFYFLALRKYLVPRKQCGPITRFRHYLVTYKNENVPDSIKILPKFDLKLVKYLKNLSNGQRHLIFLSKWSHCSKTYLPLRLRSYLISFYRIHVPR